MDGLTNVTARIARMSLDAYMARHQVLANNIANIDTPGYKPLQLNFEQQLTALQAAISTGEAGDDELVSLSDAVRPFAEKSVASLTQGDQAMRLDDQMSQLTQNTLQYEALLAAMDQLGAINRLAINGSSV